MQQVIKRYRYSVILLRELVRTDFKIRYQDSALGYIWSLLRPLLMFLILYFVFTKFIRVGSVVPHYAVYLLLGIVLWNFFAELTVGSVGAIVGKSELLRKINFPKYNIILANSISALINLLLNFIVIAIFMAFNNLTPSIGAFLIIPLVIELYIISLGVAFLLSALYVRFRDISYVWDVIVQAAFYATPILYPLSIIPYHRIQELLILNPISQIIQDARYALVTHDTSTINQVFGGDKWIWLIPITLTVLVALAGSLYFRKRSKYFAEET